MASLSATSPTLLNHFAGIGVANSVGVPPDPVGAVGKTQYVQAINSALAVWDKATGNLLLSPINLDTIWTGYPNTDGNGCATQNDGDPIILYDKAADRWVIAQFSLPNLSSNTGPSFECVAVSKTDDATGAYWLYDFKYNAGINDQSKLGVWPDAYYFSTNLFSGAGAYIGPDYCAYDRSSMLVGAPASQVCFVQAASSPLAALPADLDGSTQPPAGATGYFLGLNTSSTLNLWKFHVDWANTGNSTLTGPTHITVTSYTQACAVGACVAQPNPGALLPGLGDRLMFRVAYRNFGDHESIVGNHAVTSGAVVGIRWYEIRSPASTPVVYQSATYAPDNSLFRWNGSIAMDRQGDIALGYSASSSAVHPSIRFAGRLAADTPSDMGAESVLYAGSGSETTPSLVPSRWGDYSTMSVDPVDDCTFWYTNEYYDTTGFAAWSTRIGSLAFPTCAQNATTTALTTACMTTFVTGHAFTMTAAVTPSSAGGNVDFSNGQGTTLCGAVALQTGMASCTTSALAPGAYALGAVYNGDATDTPSSSPALGVTVLSSSDAIYRNGFDAVPNGCPAM